jgi:hypothetical protein
VILLLSLLVFPANVSSHVLVLKSPIYCTIQTYFIETWEDTLDNLLLKSPIYYTIQTYLLFL